MNNELPKIYFLHIHKTAGSSLAGLIRRAYGLEKGIPAHNFPALTQLTREQINSYRCYTGHFGTGLFSLLNEPIPTVTILRDPFDRTMSQIRHAERQIYLMPFFSPRDALSEAWNFIRRTPTHPLERSLRPPFGPMIVENFQTRSLGVDLDFNPFLGKGDRRDFTRVLHAAYDSANDATILKNAKRRLDSMTVVGTVARFTESVSLICEHIGVPAPTETPTENVASGKTPGQSYRESDAIPPRIIQRIEELTALDRELYDYANLLLDKRLAQRKAGVTLSPAGEVSALSPS